MNATTAMAGLLNNCDNHDQCHAYPWTKKSVASIPVLPVHTFFIYTCQQVNSFSSLFGAVMALLYLCLTDKDYVLL
jgi:hypothetical protein